MSDLWKQELEDARRRYAYASGCVTKRSAFHTTGTRCHRHHAQSWHRPPASSHNSSCSTLCSRCGRATTARPRHRALHSAQEWPPLAWAYPPFGSVAPQATRINNWASSLSAAPFPDWGFPSAQPIQNHPSAGDISESSSSSLNSPPNSPKQAERVQRDVEIQTEEPVAVNSVHFTIDPPVVGSFPNASHRIACSNPSPIVTYFSPSDDENRPYKRKQKSLFRRLFHLKSKGNPSEVSFNSAVLVEQVQRVVREEVARGLSMGNTIGLTAQTSVVKDSVSRPPNATEYSSMTPAPSASPSKRSVLKESSNLPPHKATPETNAKKKKSPEPEEADSDSVSDTQGDDDSSASSSSQDGIREEKQYVAGLGDDKLVAFVELAFGSLENSVKSGKDPYKLPSGKKPTLSWTEQKRILQAFSKCGKVSAGVSPNDLASLVSLVLCNCSENGVLNASSSLNVSYIQAEDAWPRAKFSKFCKDKTILRLWELVFRHAGSLLRSNVPLEHFAEALTRQWTKREKSKYDSAKIVSFLEALADKTEPLAKPKPPKSKAKMDSDDDSSEGPPAHSLRTPGLGQNALGTLRPKPKPKARARLISDGGADGGYAGGAASMRARMAALSDFDF